MVNIAVPADHRMKVKESENLGKYPDLAKKLKKQWYMRVTVISVIDYQEKSPRTKKRNSKNRRLKEELKPSRH